MFQYFVTSYFWVKSKITKSGLKNRNVKSTCVDNWTNFHNIKIKFTSYWWCKSDFTALYIWSVLFRSRHPQCEKYCKVTQTEKLATKLLFCKEWDSHTYTVYIKKNILKNAHKVKK